MPDSLSLEPASLEFRNCAFHHSPNAIAIPATPVQLDAVNATGVYRASVPGLPQGFYTALLEPVTITLPLAGEDSSVAEINTWVLQELNNQAAQRSAARRQSRPDQLLQQMREFLRQNTPPNLSLLERMREFLQQNTPPVEAGQPDVYGQSRIMLQAIEDRMARNAAMTPGSGFLIREERGRTQFISTPQEANVFRSERLNQPWLPGLGAVPERPPGTIPSQPVPPAGGRPAGYADTGVDIHQFVNWMQVRDDLDIDPRDVPASLYRQEPPSGSAVAADIAAQAYDTILNAARVPPEMQQEREADVSFEAFTATLHSYRQERAARATAASFDALLERQRAQQLAQQLSSTRTEALEWTFGNSDGSIHSLPDRLGKPLNKLVPELMRLGIESGEFKDGILAVLLDRIATTMKVRIVVVPLLPESHTVERTSTTEITVRTIDPRALPQNRGQDATAECG